MCLQERFEFHARCAPQVSNECDKDRDGAISYSEFERFIHLHSEPEFMRYYNPPRTVCVL